MRYFLIPFIFCFNSLTFASPIDTALKHQIEKFNLRPTPILKPNPNKAQVELGEKLFNETKLSGNNRVSCSSCHTVNGVTSDSLPMSRTENNRGILRRNTPALFNLGLPETENMFLDGRVHFDSKKKIFTTPEPDLNGASPKAHLITKALSSALSAQALFPLLAHNEMLGLPGENEIANAPNRVEAWRLIVARLKSPEYSKLFQQAYPTIPREKITIGHVAEAIGAFEKEKFIAINSPFERYLRGDKKAMTPDQKRGLFLFMGSGKCINCHNGPGLGNNKLFASIAAPQWGEAPLKLDTGRAEVTKKPAHNFFFKVPALTNVALTAPYMHNGSFQTLREIIEHYNHISGSLNDFEVSNDRRGKIPVEVAIEKNPAKIDDIWLSSQSGLTPKLQNRLFLTPPEKHYLEIFLREAMSDPAWVKKSKLNGLRNH